MIYRLAVACILASVVVAAQAPAPAPSVASATRYVNTTGSLGSLCSSQAGLQTALQGVASNQDTAGLGIPIPSSLNNPASLQQVAQIAFQYIYTYALPLYSKSLAGNSANGTQINTFYSSNDHLANYNDTGGVTPNHDTLYNLAFLDLSLGPQIITVPQFDTPQRYWIVPFADAYYNIYGAVGSHFNSSAGQYLVVGRNGTRNTTAYPGFTSDRIFFSPTDINWVIGRVLVLNDTDTPNAYAFSQQYRVSPYSPLLNLTLNNANSKAQIISRSVNGSGYGVYKNTVGYLAGLSLQNPAAWFNASLVFYQTDPPGNGTSAAEVSTLQTLIRNASDPSQAGAFQLGNQVASKCIINTNLEFVASTGWTFHNDSGVYNQANGIDYLGRAQDAQYIPTPLPPSEVIYYLLNTDSQAQPLDASRGQNYTITFNLPIPASIFWSLTIYNSSNLLLFRNPIDRYNINDRSQGLVYSGTNNNTLQVFISASAPANGTAQYANWLPAPTDAGFQFIFRTYGPPDYAIQGQYAPPAVIKANSSATVTSSSTAGRKFV